MIKAIILAGVFLFHLALYCCVVQGKREDECMEQLFREKFGAVHQNGKEVGCKWENQE